ncbi:MULTISPECIES: hypothetical protein [Staphylococcus]|uniref:Uncharacterized protein n=1 Tax=Staphylococcus equorum TaxID=246432 RepID=A0A9X4LEZ2_9STAP|nr:MULTISPECIES: hypothetical protein [Staphylococcus]MDG0842913.1 hypothetical protein [Staphylococcus equorum]MDG0859465.1 hypothetical protein [Staphylococcus equorum]
MMNNFLKYQFRNFGRSYKFIPPYVIYITWIMLLYVYKDIPILSSYGISFIVLTFISTWLTVMILQSDTLSEKELHYIQLQSLYKYLIGKFVFSLLLLLPLILFAIGYPVIMNVYDKNIQFFHLFLGVYSHISGCILGISIAFILANTSLSNKKYAWLMGVFILLISLLKEVFITYIPFLKSISWILPPFSEINEILTYGDNVKMNTTLLFNMGYTYFYLIVLVLIFFIIIKKSDLKE